MKIAFIDHWPNFRLENNYFFHLLKGSYDLEINQVDPDLLFLHTDSYRWKERRLYKDHPAKRVFWTMEGEPPNFDADTYPPDLSIITTGGKGYNDPDSQLTKQSTDFSRKYYYGRCDFALTHEIMDDASSLSFAVLGGPDLLIGLMWGNYGEDSEPSDSNS